MTDKSIELTFPVRLEELEEVVSLTDLKERLEMQLRIIGL